MPAPIIGAIVYRITNALQVTAWDGETPRQDTAGNNIDPGAVTTPSIWPAVNVVMQGKMEIANNFGDLIEEQGNILIRMWGVTRAELEGTLDSAGNIATPGLLQNIFALLSTGWSLIVLGAPSFTISAKSRNWKCEQIPKERAKISQFIYEAELEVDIYMGTTTPTDGDSPHP